VTPCALLAAAFVALARPAAAEVVTPIADILQDKAKHDHRWLCVAGRATEVSVAISPVRHHKFWTAKLADDAARIVLFAYGAPPFSEGDAIEACGIFARLKKARSTGEIFRDEFNVTNVLQGASMRAGKVKITPKGIVAVAADGKETAPKYKDPAQPLSR